MQVLSRVIDDKLALLQDETENQVEEIHRVKWIDQSMGSRVLICARETPVPLLLKCRTRGALGGKKRVKKSLGLPKKVQPELFHRLRLRMELLWQQLRIPFADRDLFTALYCCGEQKNVSKVVEQIQLLEEHRKLTCSVLAKIKLREQSLLNLERALKQTASLNVLIATCNLVLHATMAVIYEIRRWRELLWLPRPFRWKKHSGYLSKLQSDVRRLFSQSCSNPKMDEIAKSLPIFFMTPYFSDPDTAIDSRIDVDVEEQVKYAQFVRDQLTVEAKMDLYRKKLDRMRKIVPTLKWSPSKTSAEIRLWQMKNPTTRYHLALNEKEAGIRLVLGNSTSESSTSPQTDSSESFSCSSNQESVIDDGTDSAAILIQHWYIRRRREAGARKRLQRWIRRHLDKKRRYHAAACTLERFWRRRRRPQPQLMIEQPSERILSSPVKIQLRIQRTASRVKSRILETISPKKRDLTLWSQCAAARLIERYWLRCKAKWQEKYGSQRMIEMDENRVQSIAASVIQEFWRENHRKETTLWVKCLAARIIEQYWFRYRYKKAQQVVLIQSMWKMHQAVRAVAKLRRDQQTRLESYRRVWKSQRTIRTTSSSVEFDAFC